MTPVPLRFKTACTVLAYAEEFAGSVLPWMIVAARDVETCQDHPTTTDETSDSGDDLAALRFQVPAPWKPMWKSCPLGSPMAEPPVWFERPVLPTPFDEEVVGGGSTISGG